MTRFIFHSKLTCTTTFLSKGVNRRGQRTTNNTGRGRVAHTDTVNK